MAAFVQLAQELVEESHLAAVLDEALVVREGRQLRTLEEIRMVGALAQLHEHVEHARRVGAHRVKQVDVLGEDV